MPGEINGTKAVLQVDFGTGFMSIVGQIEFNQSYNGSPIDISNKSYADYIVSLDGELSDRSVIISGKITYNSDSSIRLVRDAKITSSILQMRIIDVSDATVLNEFVGMFSAMSDDAGHGESTATNFEITANLNISFDYVMDSLGVVNYWTQVDGLEMIGMVENNPLTLGVPSNASKYVAVAGADYNVSYSGYTQGIAVNQFKADTNNYRFDGDVTFGWFQKTDSVYTLNTMSSGRVYGGQVNTANLGNSVVYNDSNTTYPTTGTGHGEKLFVLVKLPVEQKYVVYAFDKDGLIGSQDVAYAGPSATHTGYEDFFLNISPTTVSAQGYISTPFIFDKALTLDEISKINESALK